MIDEIESKIEYRLGKIDARLDENDRVHALILSSLNKIECGIEKLEQNGVTNAVDIAGIKGRASVWGSIFGFISGLIALVLSRLLYKVQ